MNDEDKTKEQLIAELAELRRRVVELEAAETERKRAEEALRLSEEQFSKAFHSGPLLMTISAIDDGTYLEVNENFVRISGYGREDSIGTTSVDLGLISGKDREELKQTLLSKGKVDGMELTLRKKSGETFYCLYFGELITIAGKQRLLSIAEDITERKRAEEEIRQRSRELMALLEVSGRLASQLDVDELLDTITRSSVDALPAAEASSLWLYDEQSNQLTVRAWAGHDDEAMSGLAVSPDTSLVGLIWQTRQPKIIDDVSREPAFERLGWPAVDAIRSVIGVPLMVEDKLLGVLFTDNYSRVQAFDENDLRLLQSLANQAAIALDNARLFEQVQVGRDRMRRLARQMVSAQEEERRYISQELHDELGQALTGIAFDLAAIEEELGPELAPAIKNRLAEARALADQVDERVSEIALDLRPSMLDDLGLLSALHWYVNRYTQRLDIEVEMEVVGLDGRLFPEVETALFRIVQEALTNVAKHAQASKVGIRLERTESALVAIVEDDGQGFDVETIAGPTPPERGAGLLGIQERADFLRGTLSIESTPGQGTKLTIEIPI